MSWTRMPFDDCIEPVKYTTKIQRKDFLETGRFPIVSQEEGAINGYWDDPADLFRVETPVVIFGDHTRVFKYVDFDFVLGADGVKVLRPRPFVDPRFLYYQLLSCVPGSRGYARHYRLLRESSLSVPPLFEQKRIVAVLDEAFEGIDAARTTAEQNRQNARAIFDSHVASIFAPRGDGWCEVALDEVCGITSALVDPRLAPYRDLFHIGAGNIESGTGALSDVKTARQENLISGKFPFDETMVLYSKIRPYLMKAARPDFDGLCSADIYPLAPNPKRITRDYLFHLLLSKPFTDYAMLGSARAGMPKVNREHLFKFRTWLPGLDEQERITTTIDDLHAETQRLDACYVQKLDALAALKQSLLHHAFTGEL